MRRTRFDDWDCSVARTVDVLGDWWTPMVLRSAFLGVRRFDEFIGSLGIPRNVLTERLGRLCDEAILVKEPYQDRPPRYEYRLTDKGRALYPVMVAMLQWGNDWLEWGPDGPPLDLVDPDTGEVIQPVLVDATSLEPLDPRRTRAVYKRGSNAGRPDGD